MCSTACVEIFILEEEIHDIDWYDDDEPIRPSRLLSARRTTLIAKRRTAHYFVRDRQALLQKFLTLVNTSATKFAKSENVPPSTFRGWLARKEEYLDARKVGRRKQIGTSSADVVIPFGVQLVNFMKDVRREEQILTTARMIAWISVHRKTWLHEYLYGKKDGYRYDDYSPFNILNVDETSVYHDMPPRRTWAEVGKSSKANVQFFVLGRKFPILFIVHGKPGGQIDTNEVPRYPSGHHYCVQEDAWMDKSVWMFYLHHVLKPMLDPVSPSVIVADNLKCHVSAESVEAICTDLCCDFAPLPENSTGMCQPLDVGVMGPLKAMLRTAWLTEHKVYTAPQRRMAMITRVIKVWEAFNSATVAKAFAKALPKPSDLD
ncbi:hypothetical protein ACHHYP_20484 [Achlya hypogyna]|uniref:DDE-1 domain-containing protein n=1 Tax=Achlya hypogyna TaxID=1202772 RepID=A0A1V9YL65_ACHHY|nr:hypothetical protein ACHHYP_20484 [Achlya hypogyna]